MAVKTEDKPTEKAPPEVRALRQSRHNPRVLDAAEFARREVWTEEPESGKPYFTKKDNRKICGSKADSVVGPKGEPMRCEAKCGKHRCRKHGGGKGKNKSGRTPSPEALAKKAEKIAETLDPEDLIKRWLGAGYDVEITGDLLSAFADIRTFEQRKNAVKRQLAVMAEEITPAHWAHAAELFETVKNSGGSPAGVAAMQELGKLLHKGGELEQLDEKLTKLTLEQSKLREAENKRLAAAEDMLSKRVVNAMVMGSGIAILKVLDERLAPLLARYGVPADELRGIKQAIGATIGSSMLGEPRAALPQ